MSSAVQGKYFLVEESQARLSAEEYVIELGFCLQSIQTPKKKRTSRETMSLFKRLFNGRPTSYGTLSTAAPLDDVTTTSTALAHNDKKASSASSSSNNNKKSSSSTNNDRAHRSESKTIIQYPTCMLRVFASEETEKPVESIQQDQWREVYQSDVHRVVNLVPVTLTSLLLLPIPPIIATKGTDKRDRPIRFELWVGAASGNKRSIPDVLMGVKETTLAKLLLRIGAPKRFASSPTCQSAWYTLFLRDPEAMEGVVALPNDQATEDSSNLEIRVGFPDRLISVAVPASNQEVESTEWRLPSFFSGPTLRGLVFAPVSRGFQAPVSEAAETLSKTVIEPKKKLPVTNGVNGGPGKFVEDASTTLMEFREEMAEMPLNLDIPAEYLDQAASQLEQTCNAYVQRVKADIAMVRKITISEQALSGDYLAQKKVKESEEKVEKFAIEAAAKGLERVQEMREVSMFYRAQWQSVVLEGRKIALPMRDARVSRVTAVATRDAASTSVSSQGSDTNNNVGSHSSLLQGSGIGSVMNSAIEEDFELPPPPPSTPNPPEELDEGDEDDRYEQNLKNDFEKVTGVKAVKQSECSFRPSTSRKDRRLRFMPINMHLQVLTVRETDVKHRLQQKMSNVSAAAPVVVPPPTLRQRLKSVVSSSPSVSIASHHSSSAIGNKSSKEALEGIVPMISEESDGPLILATRRRGRQSIMQSKISLGGDETSSAVQTGGAATPTSNRMRINTLGSVKDINEDADDSTIGSGAGESFFYDTISAGAPSAHHLSSKQGGLWQMFRELTKAKDEMRRLKDAGQTDLIVKLDALRKAREMEWAFAERVDVVLPQAISIVVGSVLARLFVMAAEYSASLVGGYEEPDDEVAQSIVKHGWLIGWESLLSTHGKELAMLGDLFYAVRYVSEHVQLRLEMYEIKDDEDDDDDGASSAAEATNPLLGEALKVRLVKTSAKVVSKKIPGGGDNHWLDTAQYVGPGGVDDGSIWLVCAKIPSAVVEKLPKVLRTYVEKSQGETLGGDLNELKMKPLSWTCVLFTQGINEMQNIANMVGSRALQEEINEYSCMRLVEYCRKRFDVRPENGAIPTANPADRMSIKKQSLLTQSKDQQLKDEERKRRAEVAYRQSLVWAAKLKLAVSNQANQGKSFEILQNSADLVRWLSGIRIASCKSAKDRTAMSLTWEEARILHNVHFVRDIPLLDLANLFREHGTRLINVHKNTGVPRYAFNKTQRSFLPEFYRPPPNTIGGYFGMSNVT